MRAKEIMTPSPQCCLPTDNCREAAKFMRTHNCGLIPVVSDFDSNRLVGVVTDRDLTIRVLAIDRDPAKLTIQDVMTKDPITVSGDSDLRDVENAMAEHRVRRIPITGPNNRLLGIVSQADLALKATEHELAEVVKTISQPTKESHL